MQYKNNMPSKWPQTSIRKTNRSTDTGNRLTAAGGEGGDWMELGDTTSQRTVLHDAWTQTMIWVEGGARLGLGGGGKRGETGNN